MVWRKASEDIENTGESSFGEAQGEKKADVKFALGQFRLAVSHAHSLFAEAEFQVMTRLNQVEVALRTLHRIALTKVVVSEPADVFMCKLDFLLGTTGQMTTLFPADSGLLS